jgi:hypothetical protein
MSTRIKLAVAGAAIAGAMALPMTAAAGGYGKSINDGCGATYGQLVSQARQIGHISGGVSGAKGFVESGLAAAHGCDV